MDPVDALRALGGSALRAELDGHVKDAALRAAVADGRVVRLRRAYCLPVAERPVQLACALRGTRSHATAAAHWGWSLPPDRPERTRVTLPFKARRDRVPADVRLFYRDLDENSVADGVTTRLQTVVDCLRDESLRVAIAVGDSAVARGDVSTDELVAAVAGLRGPGSAVARTRVRLLDERSANAFESSCRAILIEAGIAGFVPQTEISHRGQFIGRVDLADPVLRIVIECDGFETHGSLDAMTRDATRHTWLVSAGWRPLRLTWYQVMFQPGWVLERVQDTVSEAQTTRITVQSRRRRQKPAVAAVGP